MFKYTIANGQHFRGHNLCWGVYNPSWLTKGNFNAGQLSDLLQDHITNVMQGVRKGANNANVLAWDVVNEAIGWDGNIRKWGFKDADPWYPTLKTYVEDAFKFARKADPEAQLFYNDYNIVSSNKGKRDAIYDMAKDF